MHLILQHSLLQVALEEERDKAEESRIVHEADNKLVSKLRFEIEQLQMDKVDSRMMHEADNKVIAELKYEVEQLQIELEVGRQNLRMQETINAERDKSENQRIVNDQLETNRKEELRVDAENRFRIQNEQNKIERSETFREFYSENIRVKKAQEEQMEREKKNETFLKEQQYLLDETIKLLSAATDGKSREARNAEVDVNLGGQIRYFKELSSYSFLMISVF